MNVVRTYAGTVSSMNKDPIHLVSVLVDEVTRLGPLTYSVPSDTVCLVGDAVSVPFGKTIKHGLVIGPGAACKGTIKSILKVHGSRVNPLDLTAAETIAKAHYCTFSQVAQRVSPRSNRNSDPLSAGELVLVASTTDALPVCETNWRERVILKAPLSGSARLAALEAARVKNRGQILIVCPTVQMVEDVLGQFVSGAARLDSKARAGAWNGWRTGTVTVGVGTRTAALYSALLLDGIIVVDEEHPGHREASVPYTHSRQIAKTRAELHRCSLTFIASAPSCQSLHGTKVLPVAKYSKLWPNIVTVDRAQLHPSLTRNPPLVEKLMKNTSLTNYIVADNQDSRRLCGRCKTPSPCQTCDKKYCEHPVESPCLTCGSGGFMWVGWGEDRLKHTYKKHKIIKLKDVDTISSEPVRLIVPNFENIVKSSGLSVKQNSLSSIIRVIGAAGRAGEVVIVHSGSVDPLLETIRKRDTLPYIKNMWTDARKEGLPPFGVILTVKTGRKAAPNTSTWPGTVYGPRKTLDGWDIMIHVGIEDYAELEKVLVSFKKPGKTRIIVD